MKILTLIIKQKYFDEIVAGTKTQEFREVRPTTFKKYLRYLVNGEEFASLDDIPEGEPYDSLLEKEGFDVTAIPYDAIRFYVGYNKDRDSALVRVTGTTLEYIVDENDQPIVYEYKGNEYYTSQMVYDLGEIIEKEVHEK